MNLLIVTQKADWDDSNLGFFHTWINEFAKNCTKVSVICLEEGRHEFPTNVRVYSLGKVKGTRSGFADRLKYAFTFFGYVWSLRKDYDAVFVHMNPIYLVQAGWLWKLMNKKIGLWYTHKHTDWKLRVGERYADVIFTAAKESFTMKSNKVQVVGHGIDITAYTHIKRAKPFGTEPISIATISRMTPIKDPITLIEAARILKEKWQKRFTLTFIGSPIMKDDGGYSKKVHDLVATYNLNGIVKFVGDVNIADIPKQISLMDVSINLTPTGGLDKVVLESMAGGVPVITSNLAFKEYFGTYADRLTFERGNAEELANKIMDLFESGQVEEIGKGLQKVAFEKADLGKLIEKISGSLA